MKRLLNMIQTFFKDDDGVTAIEYGLIAGLIAVAIIVTVGLLGQKLDAIFEYIRASLPIPG